MSDVESEHSQPALLTLTSDQKYLKEFILILKSMPELWDASSKNYINKIKRAAGYEKLLVILKKINENSTVNDVRKKINSLRSNYRKELKKVIESKRSGAGTPKSWTFYALQFLRKNEQPVRLNLLQYQSVEDVSEVDEQREDLSNTSFSSISEPPPPRKPKKSGGLMTKQNELIEKACSLLSTKPDSANRKINSTALYWTEKLEKLHPTQHMIAEKAINDILFEAELGNLSRDSVQINVSSNANNTKLSLTPLQEPTIYQQLPTATSLYAAAQKPDRNKVITIQKPPRIFVPPPTPSPDSNFSTTQPSDYMSPICTFTPSPALISPCNLSPQLPASGQPMFIHQPEIGATKEIEGTEEYSIRSFFSSFDDN